MRRIFTACVLPQKPRLDSTALLSQFSHNWGAGRWALAWRREWAPPYVHDVSGATESTWPQSIRCVTHGYVRISGRTTQDPRIFQSGISPKVDVNPGYETNHTCSRFLVPRCDVHDLKTLE